MKFRTEGKPAPGQLVVIHGFLNTWSDELGVEDFGTPQAAAHWLRAAGLWSARRGPSAADLETLKAFRFAVRDFVLNPSAKTQIAKLNQYAADVKVGVRFGSRGEAALEVDGDCVAGVIGNLIRIIYTSQIDGTWALFKCCELETCGWAFYDFSRNHSGRWCSMKTCGSRHKAREYLKRKAARA